MGLTAERLRELLHYCRETGVFTWRKVRTYTALAGSVAGGLHKSTGYIRIKIDGVQHQAHRLAWLYVYGTWPTPSVDHINRQRADNRIINLRIASYAQQRANAKLNRDNTSGYRGVHWDKYKLRWKATISREHLGSFSSKEAAIAAVAAAFDKLVGPEWRPNGS